MLRIAKLTDYAILLLSHFCLEGKGQRTARELAEETGLTIPTVSKLLKLLHKAQIVVSQRGVQGGYSLARRADVVTVAEIIAAVEGPIALTECSDHGPTSCDLEPRCALRANWRKINQVVLRSLENLTLADMARPLGRPCLSEGREGRSKTSGDLVHFASRRA